MSEILTPKQALILWALLGRQGTALQSKLVPKVTPADREALVDGGYLTVEPAGRSVRLTVADKGWRWAGDNLTAPLAPNVRVLQDWLALVRRHLDKAGISLADFVGPPPEPEPLPPKPARRPRKPAGEAKAAGKTKAVGKAKPADKADTTAGTKPNGTTKPAAPRPIRERIEDAYRDLTGGETAKAVRLSVLRARLSDLDRAAVDAGLAAILRGDETARLSQLTDPKALNAAEREAAYNPAGEPFHLIWIQS